MNVFVTALLASKWISYVKSILIFSLSWNSPFLSIICVCVCCSHTCIGYNIWNNSKHRASILHCVSSVSLARMLHTYLHDFHASFVRYSGLDCRMTGKKTTKFELHTHQIAFALAYILQRLVCTCVCMLVWNRADITKFIALNASSLMSLGYGTQNQLNLQVDHHITHSLIHLLSPRSGTRALWFACGFWWLLLLFWFICLFICFINILIIR